jgi:hypothetical protein
MLLIAVEVLLILLIVVKVLLILPVRRRQRPMLTFAFRTSSCSKYWWADILNP